MCWQLEGTQCYKHPSGKSQETADISVCRKCEVYNSSFILDCRTLAIVDANATAEKSYGYTKKEFLKLTFGWLGDKEDEQKIFSNFINGKKQRILFPKKRHRKKDSEHFYVNVHVCDIEYLGQDCLIATTSDITDSVQKELQS